MGRSKRSKEAALEESATPPSQLQENQSLARIVKLQGNSLYACALPDGKTIVAELASRFRKTVWVKRGGFVLVERIGTDGQTDNGLTAGRRVDGVIINVVRDKREWRKLPYWPQEFVKQADDDEDEDEESTVGKLPPSDSEDGYDE